MTINENLVPYKDTLAMRDSVRALFEVSFYAGANFTCNSSNRTWMKRCDAVLDIA